MGCLALCMLAGHGASYLVWKTAGIVQERSRTWARKAWLTALPFWLLATRATAWIQPEEFKNLVARPWSLTFVLLTMGGFAGGLYFLARGRDLAAFLSSSALLLGLVGAAMAGNYPYWLRSTLDPVHGLTAANTAASDYGLRVALYWWTIGAALAVAYFFYVFRSFRGKVCPIAEGHGY